MIIEKSKITGKQLMFSVACFLMASVLLTGFASNIVGHDTWLAVIAAAVIALPVIMIYMSLMKKFPTLNLFGINEKVFGKALGRIVSLLYLFFFHSLTTLTLMGINDLLKENIMYRTPSIVLVALTAVVAAWAVRSGIKTVMRYSELFFILAATLLAGVVIVATSKENWNHFLPIFDVSVSNFTKGTGRVLTIPLLEISSILMIIPNIEKPDTVGRKYLLRGFLIAAVCMTLVVYTDISILGNSIALLKTPSFETLRMIKFTMALSRMEVFFAMLITVLLFFKFSFLLYVTTLLFAQILGQKTYRPFVLGVAAITCAYFFFIIPISVQSKDTVLNQLPVLWLVFEFLLPAVTLLVASVRKLPHAAGKGEDA